MSVCCFVPESDYLVHEHNDVRRLKEGREAKPSVAAITFGY
jgi:hypothetical protein